MTFMNWIYIWGHWPVITAVLFWLFLRHPAGYREVRNTMLLSGGIGLFVFALYPVAPPRLAGLGLVDTVTEYSTSYRVLQPPAFVNQYAAMPSLHVGWDLLMGIAMLTWSTHLVVRLLGIALPTLMALSVVLTANHYVIDAVAGIALVLACLWVVRSRALRRVARPVLPAQRRGDEPVSDGAPADPCVRSR
jgi:membrane-associated phospholipid phosphatase